MPKIISILQVIAPIFVAIALGILTRKKNLMTAEEVRGFQKFTVNFGLPCVIFSSCLTADIGVQSLTAMVMVILTLLIGTFWAFAARRKQFPYHNLPMLFAAQESGMLGIPLFVILFGAAQAYQVGVLDLAQAAVAMPMIAILSSSTGENPDVKKILKNVLLSPLILMCALGLVLNFSGIRGVLDNWQLTGILTESAGFITQPISALMIFSVGYNFSLDRKNLPDILKLSGIRFAMMAVLGVLMQLVLLLIPDVDPRTRWALLLYCSLPSSYLAPNLGKTEADAAVASGVCSLLTVTNLAVFCVMAALLA